jgi:F0F1-type ATP synthase epsilon subunit
MKHAAILTTFKAGTIYYFEAKSQDEKGNIAVSGEYSLHTPRPKANVLKAIVDNMEALIRQIKPR